MTDIIAGSGGGGGKSGSPAPAQYTPVEQPNSLFSTAYVRAVDLLSEGEIHGLVNGAQSIYLEGTPLLNPDNVTFNFSGVGAQVRTGTQNQSYFDGFDEVSSITAVNVVVQQATPVVRTITDVNTDGVRVTISIPQLQRTSTNGDILGSVFRFQIAVQRGGGGYTVVVDDTVRGRSSSLYQRNYLLTGLTSGPFPIDIKLTRITADSSEQDVGGSSALITNAFSWYSYSRITWGRLRYPNSAMVALRVNAEQFTSVPTRSYRIRGIKVSIPNTATVDSATGRLIYTGVWTGTFGAAQWTSDPAWCLWDLLTNTRYGFGDHIDTTQLDKWAFYSASQYCAELVPDGFGGTEPRFSCNVNIQTADDAYKLINDMCSVFRAMPYWSAGALTISQDRPQDPSYLFTYANVGEEGFSYSGSSIKTRPTVAVVQYMDLDLRDVAYELVEDAAGIAAYGVVKTEITAFACTSRGQAHRVGDWLLSSNRYETETVNFTTSTDAGVIVRPGQIIEISDPVRSGTRKGGRILSATTTAITVDDATGLTTANTPTLSVILPTGEAQQRSITAISGSVITVSPGFSVAPAANSVWIHASTTMQTSKWRVLTVQEQEECKYSITALAYNASKFGYVERGIPLQSVTVSNLNAPPAPPTSLVFNEALYTYRDQISSKVIIGWVGVAGVSTYLLKYRKDSGSWNTVNISQQDFEILDATPGYFEVEVYSRGAGGQVSATALTGSFTAQGKTAPPSDVPAFSSALEATTGVLLSWTPVAELDIRGYEIRQGAAWSTGASIGIFTTTSTRVSLPSAGTTTWWIKVLDTSGSYSTNALSTSVTIVAPATPSLSQQVTDNTVKLSWTDSTRTLPISYYILRSGLLWDTATSLGAKQGLFTTLSEAVPGSYTYWIAAVDTAGNVSSPVSAVAVVGAAPDYENLGTLNSTFGGTAVNAVITAQGLVAAVDTAETWQAHFTSRGWTTPQAQIDAGYPIYALPSASTASYTEDFDYGSILTSAQVTASVLRTEISGAITITPTLRVKAALGDPWTVYAGQASVYAYNFRYVQLSYAFSTLGGLDLVLLSGLALRFSIKAKTDMGVGTANAGDSGGTTVLFNVAFASVESIVVTPSGTTARLALYDFTSVPNPTSFKVLLFDTAGSRVSGAFSWQVRGT
jgi:hypothetical protein